MKIHHVRMLTGMWAPILCYCYFLKLQYQEHIHNLSSWKPGTARHIIVTVEQLFKSPEGHFPCLASLIWNKYFQCRIKWIHINEAHYVHTAGLAHYGNKAFWPAWAQLDELKALLPCSIPWQAISAMYPQHILKTVESKILCPNYVSIHTSCNHPNTMYAMHCVPTRIEDCKNYECFLLQPFEPAYQPRILIFFDDTDLATAVSNLLDSLLLIPYRAKGIIQHYHSRMSEQYLCEAHSAFTQDNGICKILCVTSGQSVGAILISLFYISVQGCRLSGHEDCLQCWSAKQRCWCASVRRSCQSPRWLSGTFCYILWSLGTVNFLDWVWSCCVPWPW